MLLNQTPPTPLTQSPLQVVNVVHASPSPTPSVALTETQQPIECPHNACFVSNPLVHISQDHLTAMKHLFGCRCQTKAISKHDYRLIADYLFTIFDEHNWTYDPEYDGTLGSGRENGEFMPPYMTLHLDVTQQLLCPRNHTPVFPYEAGGERRHLHPADDLAAWWDAQKIMVWFDQGTRRYKLNHLEEASLELVFEKVLIKLNTLNRHPWVAEQLDEDFQDTPCACFHSIGLDHLPLPPFISQSHPGSTEHTIAGYSTPEFRLNLFHGSSFPSVNELRFQVQPLQIWAHFTDFLANALGSMLNDRGVPRLDPHEVGASRIVRYLQGRYVRLRGCPCLVPHNYDWVDEEE